MTTEEAIKLLDEIEVGDPEGAHGEADDILLKCVDPMVKAAYERVVARAPWWASA
jgi:hypothetical protein